MAAKPVDWNDVFRPRFGNVLVALVVTVLYWYFRYKNVMCTPCREFIPGGAWPELMTSCSCVVGTTFAKFLVDAILVFVIPFVIVYTIYSLVCYFLVKRFLLCKR